jgi:hypothetical protein
MKPQHVHLEVLVSTTTTLAKKVLHEIKDNNKNASPVEKFEEACWSGLLNGMFSELMPTSSTKRSKVFIWEISTGKSNLLVDLADVPGTIESALSINPPLFLPELDLN